MTTPTLYRPEFEHDSCGTGFITYIDGRKSHQIVADALTMLANMEHRGACGCDSDSGDGAGVLIQLPHWFLLEEGVKHGIRLPEPGQYGVGMVFFPKKEKLREGTRAIIAEAAARLGIPVLGYRPVPVRTEGIGVTALSAEPAIEQLFLGRPVGLATEADFDRKLYVLRRLIIKNLKEQLPAAMEAFYFASLSCRTIIYKGQLTTFQVGMYYPDLSDERVTSAFGLVHSRFSTNTMPSWRLAQPFRYLAHNGEINTLRGNLNWFYAGLPTYTSPYFSAEEMEILLPVIDAGQSDSACLDNIVELLTHCGRSLPHVLMMLVPEAWDGNEQMDPLKKAFYEFHATFMAPWDGPAALNFTDGNLVGAMLDRNGLRPLRYAITNDGRVLVASEAGTLPIVPETIIKKGRLQPGKMFVVDTKAGRILTDRIEELDTANAKKQGKTMDEVRAASVKTIPAGRLGTVEEFGAAGAFLCSEAASYITGSMLRVDGGAARSF